MRLRGLFHGPELRWYHTKAVILRSRLSLCVFLAVMACLSVAIAETQKASDLDSQFQLAVSQYNSGNFAAAATKLQALVRQVPESFEVQELLGLPVAALTPAELMITRSHGFRPISAVSATCWMHYGWSWTPFHTIHGA